MRSISRVADVRINTVSKLLVDAGKFCADLHEREVRNMPVSNQAMIRIPTHLPSGPFASAMPPPVEAQRRLARLRRGVAPGGEGHLISPSIKTGLRWGNLIRHIGTKMAHCVDKGCFGCPFAKKLHPSGMTVRQFCQ